VGKRDNIKINYLSRDFRTIKDDLIQYAKRYYSDTFRDFSTAGFGALMIDSVAYIGDMLSYYLDYQANESFLTTAIEYDNVLKHGRAMGYKHIGARSTYGNVSLFVLVPANASSTGPDLSYMPILKAGSTFSSAANSMFTLLEDVNFADDSNEIVVANTDQYGTPNSYAVKTTGPVVSGLQQYMVSEIGDFVRFRRLTIPRNDVTEILSVTDSDGNEYYEVDHLSQNVIYVPINNTDTTTNLQTPNILKPMVVPRRYTVEHDQGAVTMTFGYGSHSEFADQSVSDPVDVVLNIHSKNYVTDSAIDPSQFMKTDKFGIGPNNTNLYIVYRVNTPGSSNAAVGSITNTGASLFRFPNSTTLLDSKMASVRSSLEVSNEEAIQGDVRAPRMEELKELIKGAYSSQNRAVTAEDYKSMVLLMPARFGGVSKCSVVQDVDSNVRNINIYVVSKNGNTFYEKTNQTLKENVKTWLSSKRMINDAVDILDAKIINLGISFQLLSVTGSNKSEVFNSAMRALQQYLSIDLDIGEAFSISDIYSVLNSVPGVADTISVSVRQAEGVGYSSTKFNVKNHTTPDGRLIMAPKNVVFEVKYPNQDVQGTVK